MQKPRTKADRLAALTASLDTTTELPRATPPATSAAAPAEPPPLPTVPKRPATPNPAVNLRMPAELLARYVTAAAIRSQSVGRNVTPQTIMLEVLTGANLDAVKGSRGGANG